MEVNLKVYHYSHVLLLNTMIGIKGSVIKIDLTFIICLKFGFN